MCVVFGPSIDFQRLLITTYILSNKLLDLTHFTSHHYVYIYVDKYRSVVCLHISNDILASCEQRNYNRRNSYTRSRIRMGFRIRLWQCIDFRRGTTADDYYIIWTTHSNHCELSKTFLRSKEYLHQNTYYTAKRVSGIPIIPATTSDENVTCVFVAEDSPPLHYI